MPRKTRAVSMRPGSSRIGFNEAAARCRGKLRRLHRLHPSLLASMRPRPDAAENTRHARHVKARPKGFNEAAARCRGKRKWLGPGRGRAARFNEAAARCRGKRARVSARVRQQQASMRPRPDAAENAEMMGWTFEAGNASMRPRPDAAENVQGREYLPGSPDASMRPRPDAAENEGEVPNSKWVVNGFNEAAARCRGKRCGGRTSARCATALQ